MRSLLTGVRPCLRTHEGVEQCYHQIANLSCKRFKASNSKPWKLTIALVLLWLKQCVSIHCSLSFRSERLITSSVHAGAVHLVPLVVACPVISNLRQS